MSIRQRIAALGVGLVSVLLLFFQNCAQSPDIATSDKAVQASVTPLSIDSFYPASAPVNINSLSFSIYGQSFLATDIIRVDGVTCANVHYVSSSEMACTLPASSVVKAADVSIQRADGSETEVAVTKFQYIAQVVNHVPCSSSSTTIQTKSVSVTFPASSVACTMDSTTKGAGQADGRRAQDVTVVLPSNAVICDSTTVHFDRTINTKFIYQDDFMLLFDGLVYAYSSANLVSRLSANTNGYLIYDWLKVRGLNETQAAGCADQGSGGSCAIPVRNTTGLPLDVIATAKMIRSGVASVSTGNHTFQLLMIGDGTTKDCNHSALVGTANLVYDQP